MENIIYAALLMPVLIALAIIAKSKLPCSHVFEIETSFPKENNDFQELKRWAMDNHDYYKVCKKCNVKIPIDPSYD